MAAATWARTQEWVAMTGGSAAFDAVVIGAGFAGLSAASRLAAAGARHGSLRCSRGSASTTAFHDRATGELVDNGQHVLFGCYHETFAFLRRVGAEDLVRLQPMMMVPFLDEEGRRSELRCPPLPAPWHLLAGVLDWDALPFGARLSVLRLAGPIRLAQRQARGASRGVASASPGETVATWLRLNGQGREICQWLWYPLAVAALNQSPDEAAASAFVPCSPGCSDPIRGLGDRAARRAAQPHARSRGVHRGAPGIGAYRRLVGHDRGRRVPSRSWPSGSSRRP
jgi:predicted NAD/FAD-binding protein